MRYALALALAFGVFGAAAAEDKAGPGDKTFVVKASAGGMAEVKMSKLATKRASNKGVKEFAEMMIEDHTRANKELADLAAKKDLAVAKDVDAAHKKAAEKLAELSGAEFDREYMAGQVKDHQMTIALFEKQAKSGEDDDLKKWAAKTLPALRGHLKMARQLHDTVKGKDR